MPLRPFHDRRAVHGLPVAVRDLDDGASAIRFAVVAQSRLRTLRVYCAGCADMGRVDPVALAHGEESSKFRIGDRSGVTSKWIASGAN